MKKFELLLLFFLIPFVLTAQTWTGSLSKEFLPILLTIKELNHKKI